MPLHGIDHVELWVGNAKQAAHYYTRAFGFREVAYAGLETGLRDRTSHVLKQGRIRLVLTGALTPGSRDRPAPRPPRRRRARDRALGPRRRLRLPRRRRARRDRRARAVGGDRRARHRAHGHDRRPTARRCTPSSSAATTPARSSPATRPARTPRPTPACSRIDHIVGNVELGHMNTWVKFYEDVFGMTEMLHFSDEAISTEYSALMSKVVTDGNGRVKFPINEPAEGKRKSQIDEFLEFYGGPGAQHLAVATRDIVRTVTELRERGVEFLTIPDAYYDDVPERIGEIEESLEDLRRLGILVDRDDEGYMLQIFTQADRRPPDDVLRGHRAPRRARLRRGQLQGALRGDRARAGPKGEPLMRYASLGDIPAKRHVQFRENGTPADRGGPRLRGLLRQRVDPLPPVEPVPGQGGRRVRADRARGVGARDPRPPAHQHARPRADGRPRDGPPDPPVQQRRRDRDLHPGGRGGLLLPRRRGRRGRSSSTRAAGCSRRSSARCRSASTTTS